MRPPYAFAVLLVESATMVNVVNVESNSSTRRLRMSFTSTLPPGNEIAVETPPIGSVDRATVAPRGLTGGRPWPANGEAAKSAATAMYLCMDLVTRDSRDSDIVNCSSLLTIAFPEA